MPGEIPGRKDCGISFGTGNDQVRGQMMKDQLESNKTIVRDFYNLALNLKNRKRRWQNSWGRTYPAAQPRGRGRSGPFIAFVKGFVQAFPTLHFNFKQIIAEGDLVVVHSHLVRHKDDRGVAVMDIFRLENGRVVEHWDVLQDVPGSSANENTMF